MDYSTNMQLRILVWIAGGLAVTLAPLGAQTSAVNKNDAQAQDLLRRAAAQQQSGPNKAAQPAKLPAVTNAPLAVGHPTRAELDRQYLEGRLTAKQFQKALELWLQEEQKRPAMETEKRRKEEAQRSQQAGKAPPTVATKAPTTRAASPKDIATAPAPTGIAPPATVAPPAQPTPQQAKISEVEARLDQMLRQKEAREKAALTNAATATNNIPVTPQTKRQRMDALLRQFVEGTLTEVEYNAKRARILAEPD